MKRASRVARAPAPERAPGPDSAPATAGVLEGPRVTAQRARLEAAFGAAPGSARLDPGVVQRVQAGRYTTIETGSLRNAELKRLKKVQAGSVVDVDPGAATRRFKLRPIASTEKPHTWVRHESLQGWMRDDALGRPQPAQEAQKAPANAALVPAGSAPRATTEPVPVRTAPLRIGGGASRAGGNAPRPREPQAQGDEPASSLADLPDRFPALPRLDISAGKQRHFGGLHVYVHFTKSEYRKGIHAEGLQAGKRQGIGLPSDEGRGESDKEYVYVLSSSASATTRAAVAAEAGDAPVAVISRTGAQDRDVNYPAGTHRFQGAIAPGRRGEAAAAAATISLVLPLSPHGREGLASFLNQGIEDAALRVTAAEAEVLLARELHRQHPLRFMSYKGL